jgi:hypothetical protein
LYKLGSNAMEKAALATISLSLQFQELKLSSVVCVLKKSSALLLPWFRGEGEGRGAGAAHLDTRCWCQQSVLGWCSKLTFLSHINFCCLGAPSSVASESVTQSASTKVVINSDDPAWNHCYCPDKKKHSLACNYSKTTKAGITRVKYHLACLGGNNVSKCGKVPADVKEEMLALLTKKTSEKKQK